MQIKEGEPEHKESRIALLHNQGEKFANLTQVWGPLLLPNLWNHIPLIIATHDCKRPHRCLSGALCFCSFDDLEKASHEIFLKACSQTPQDFTQQAQL
jgi:hypothetical protein